jgi:plasmid stabilization system protein ParE
MSYKVKLTSRAEIDLRDAYTWYAERSARAAERWLQRIEKTLEILRHNPDRCPVADENSRFPIELRQQNFGSGRKLTHRIIFAVRTDTVIVYAIRHVAQGEWRPDQQNDRE